MCSLGQNFGQIRPNVVNKAKELVFIKGFFIFLEEYAFTVVIRTPEWKLKTILARNTMFEEN